MSTADLRVEPADAADYRTLFVCELEQSSSLSVGGSDEAGPSDMPLLRDGNGNFLIRGSSLAGALVATARAVFGEVPSGISRIERDDDSGQPSSWRFDHGLLVAGEGMPVPSPELRAGSAHRQDTRTAADAGLHDVEVLPAQGQTWRFLLDVDLSASTAAPDVPRDDAIAARALREWAQERCWLGRKVARGLGWMRLKDCEVHCLKRAHVDLWPVSSAQSLAERVTKLRELKASSMPLDEFIRRSAATASKATFRYLRWSGTATVGEYRPETADQSPGTADRNYGIDTLQVGGHGSDYLTPEDFGAEHFVFSTELANSARAKIQPDMALAMTARPGKNGKSVLQPFLPGTSLAGSFRHWLSRRQRAKGQRIWDPVTQTDYCQDDGNGESDRVELLFGTLRGSGANTKRVASKLLFREAYLADTERGNWSVACLEHVALDPYRQKPKRGSKFNRYALMGATFEWQLVLELDASAESDEMVGLVEAFLTSACNSRVGFGGGEARGHGHLKFTRIRRTQALAGEPAWTETQGFLKAEAES